MSKNENSKPLEAIREQWLKQLIADPKAKPSYFRVAWAIACHMNRERGGWAWPGFNRIAETAFVSRRTVIRACNWMEGAGHLRIVRKRNGDRNDPNRYRPILRDGGSVSLTLGSVTGDTTLVSRVTPEPLIEPLNTAAVPCCTSDWNSRENRERWEKVLKVLGTSSDDLKWIKQRHRLSQWLADGYDFDLDILPTIARLYDAARQRGKSISSLNYFNQAIAEARAERLAPPTSIEPRTNNGKRKPLTPREYVDQLLQQSASNQGTGGSVSENPFRVLQIGSRH